MAAADGKGEPPPDLELAWMCGTHLLPEGGGVLDQNAKQLRQMKALANVYRTVQKYRGLTGDAINNDLTVSERLLLGNLAEMGIPLGMG